MSKQASQRKTQRILIIFVSVIVVLAVALAAIPLTMSLFGGGGVKTEGIDASRVQPATTDVNGSWKVTKRPGANSTSVGFTFHEILPAESKVTSGSTTGVAGEAQIVDGVLKAGEIIVDMTNITTDSDVRDNNVRRKIFHTDEYPEAQFVLTEPASIADVSGDGQIGRVELTGDLTIHGTTNRVTAPFEVVRSGEHLLVAGDLEIDRTDYGVETPEFVAAKIDEVGEINLRIKFEKQ